MRCRDPVIRRLVADGVPLRQVARQLGVARATVDRAGSSERPPKYERKPVASTAFTPFEARVTPAVDTALLHTAPGAELDRG